MDERHDWDAPDVGRLSEARDRALAILRSPETVKKVLCFYDPALNFAGATFHKLPPNDPHQMMSSDLLSITLMDVAVQPAALRRILEPGEDRASILSALERVPIDTTLADADHSTLDSAAELYLSIKQALRGNKWVTASKICARKRPALIPVRDRVVAAELKLANRSFKDDWTVLRGVVRDEAVAGALEGLSGALGATDPALAGLPAVRVLDTAVWMHGRQVVAAQIEDEVSE